jgi:2-iminobutanoate/2-iminopropanoate deaminase
MVKRSWLAVSHFAWERLGIDPDTGVVPDGVESQTVRALLNLSVIVEAAGSSMADLAKTTTMHGNVKDYYSTHGIYAGRNTSPPPAQFLRLKNGE